MLIWILLFLITVLVSLILAFRSMSDYYEKAANFATDYAIFLIGKPEYLTPQLIDDLHSKVSKDRLILAFERLFKGQKRAAVVFGPLSILRPYIDILGLVELEDYSLKTEAHQVLAWEVGIKNQTEKPLKMESLISYVPQLEDQEEFWWQIILQAKSKSKEPVFQVVIRAVLKVEDAKRAKFLEESLVEIGSNIGLAQLPQAYSNSQFLKFYQERAMPEASMLKIREKEIFPLLSSTEVISLLGFKSGS